MDEGAERVTSRHRADRVALCAVGAVTLALHVLIAVAGVRLTAQDFKAATLAQTWQLLPFHLLRHDLFSSLAHLQSQPPLFNLATAAVLELPHAMQPWAATLGMVASATLLAVASTGLLLELGVRRWVALVVVVAFVVADPAQYLYAAYWFYALPIAAIATAAGWAAVRWVRTARPWPGIAYGALAGLMILTNSSYQLYLVAIASAPIVWALRGHWRQVLAVLGVPTLLVVAWYANDVAQFGTATTSSWIGMNLARATLALDTPDDLEHLVHAHVLAPVALIRPFSPLDAYGALGTHAPTGQPGLDQRTDDGAPNYNNIAYVAISSSYLAQDLHWIVHRPVHYLRNVTTGLRIWMLPAEQFFATYGLADYHLGGYTTVYDAVVQLQPDADPTADDLATFFRLAPGLTNLSYTVLAETLLALGVLPIVAWRRRRTDPGRAAGALWVWATCALVFATTTLVEASENNRFRFELGGLPLVAATVAVAWLVDRSVLDRGLLGGPGGERDRGAREALAVDDEPPGVPAGGLELQGSEVDGHGDVDR